VLKQELLVISIVMIIVGAVVWSVTFPASAEEAANAVGQVVFWVGLILLIIWAAIIAFHAAKGDSVVTK
jgi:tellurite resistance protein TehA-like permease